MVVVPKSCNHQFVQPAVSIGNHIQMIDLDYFIAHGKRQPQCWHLSGNGKLSALGPLGTEP